MEACSLSASNGTSTGVSEVGQGIVWRLIFCPCARLDSAAWLGVVEIEFGFVSGKRAEPLGSASGE